MARFKIRRVCVVLYTCLVVVGRPDSGGRSKCIQHMVSGKSFLIQYRAVCTLKSPSKKLHGNEKEKTVQNNDC